VADYVHYSPGTVRGLEYYTGTVFEVWDLDGEFRAVIGGGRYDNLVSDVGGEPLPGVGFAMGDMVVSLVLKKFNCLPPELGFSPADVLVTVFDDGSLGESLRLAALLREQGLRVICYNEGDKLSKQFKYADKLGIRAAVVLGPDEIASQQVAVKNLRSSAQQTAPRAEAAKLIREILASQAGV
jgi:histidyl-tRNA synthetase